MWCRSESQFILLLLIQRHNTTLPERVDTGPNFGILICFFYNQRITAFFLRGVKDY